MAPFPLGRVVATPGVLTLLEEADEDPLRYLCHRSGDREELGAYDVPSHFVGITGYHCGLSFLAPETAGHPGHCPSKWTLHLRQAVFLTGGYPVTAIDPSVSAAVTGKWSKVTGSISWVTGRGPVTFSAYTSGLRLLNDLDRCDRRFLGQERYLQKGQRFFPPQPLPHGGEGIQSHYRWLHRRKVALSR